MRALASFVWLQVGWFACVLGPLRGVPWLGPAVVLVGLALHVARQEGRRRELVVLAGAAAVGFAVDTALLRTGAIAIGGASVSPLWLVALWPNFAATTGRDGSLQALARRPVLAALVGAVGGPAAYAGGARLGAIALGASTAAALAAVAVAWTLFVPALFAFRKWTAAP